MRFYKNQHQFYIGIDLHARAMYVCVVNNSGETVFHKNMACSRENLELVTDYMCLMQDAFPGIFFWIAIQALLFYFERKLHFSQKKEDCLKKTALSDYFLRILIDKLGPYMCYGKIYLIQNYISQIFFFPLWIFLYKFLKRMLLLLFFSKRRKAAYSRFLA